MNICSIPKRIKEIQVPKRTEYAYFLGKGVVDDMGDPSCQQNTLYLKWLTLVDLHMNGDIVLAGKMLRCTTAITFMSQYDVKWNITNIVSNVWSEETVCALPREVVQALRSNDIEVLEEFYYWESQWCLPKKYQEALFFWLEVSKNQKPIDSLYKSN